MSAFWREADIPQQGSDFRFASESGPNSDMAGGPFRANRRHTIVGTKKKEAANHAANLRKKIFSGRLRTAMIETDNGEDGEVSMRGIGLACTIAALALAANGPVLAQSPVGNTSSGLRVATTICGNCHQVTPTMPPSAVRSPSFADIASRPTTTALSLKQFLRSNHSRMPRFILSRADTDDVVAYILSIKPK